MTRHVLHCHLSGIHYAVLVALKESRRSTPELCKVLSGYPAEEVRDALTYLHHSDCIRQVSDDPLAWEVMA